MKLLDYSLGPGECLKEVLYYDLVLAGPLEELIKHGLRALRDTLPNEVELTTKVKMV